MRCNIDGACEGNPRLISYDFCLRNGNGDLIHAKAGFVGIVISILAEATAILKAKTYCKM